MRYYLVYANVYVTQYNTIVSCKKEDGAQLRGKCERKNILRGSGFPRAPIMYDAVAGFGWGKAAGAKLCPQYSELTRFKVYARIVLQ